MTTTKITAKYFQVYQPTEYYTNWELHFYDESKKHLVKIIIEDITKFIESINTHEKRLTK